MRDILPLFFDSRKRDLIRRRLAAAHTFDQSVAGGRQASIGNRTWRTSMLTKCVSSRIRSSDFRSCLAAFVVVLAAINVVSSTATAQLAGGAQQPGTTAPLGRARILTAPGAFGGVFTYQNRP